MKDGYTTNSHYLTYTFLFKRSGECTFWTWEWTCVWYLFQWRWWRAFYPMPYLDKAPTRKAPKWTTASQNAAWPLSVAFRGRPSSVAGSCSAGEFGVWSSTSTLTGSSCLWFWSAAWCWWVQSSDSDLPDVKGNRKTETRLNAFENRLYAFESRLNAFSFLPIPPSLSARS